MNEEEVVVDRSVDLILCMWNYVLNAQRWLRSQHAWYKVGCHIPPRISALPPCQTEINWLSPTLAKGWYAVSERIVPCFVNGVCNAGKVLWDPGGCAATLRNLLSLSIEADRGEDFSHRIVV